MKKTQLMKQPYTQLFAVFLMFSPLACQKGNDSKAKVQGKKDSGKITQCTGDQAKQFTDKLNEITARKTELKLQIDAKTLKPEEICKDQKHEQLILSCNDFINKNKDLNCQSDKEVESATSKTKAKTQKVTLKMADLQKACNEYRELVTSQSCKISEVAVPAPAPADPGTTTTTTTTTTSTTTSSTDPKANGGQPAATTKPSGTTGSSTGTPEGAVKTEAKKVEDDRTTKSSMHPTAACLKFVGLGRATQRMIGQLIQNPDMTDAEKEYVKKSARMNSDYFIAYAAAKGIVKIKHEKRTEFNSRLENLGKMTQEERTKLAEDVRNSFVYENAGEPKNCQTDASAAIAQAGLGYSAEKENMEKDFISHVKSDEGAAVSSFTAIGNQYLFVTKVNGTEGVMSLIHEKGVKNRTRFYPFKVDKTVAGYKAMNFSKNLWMLVSETDGIKDVFVLDADSSKKLPSEDSN